MDYKLREIVAQFKPDLTLVLVVWCICQNSRSVLLRPRASVIIIAWIEKSDGAYWS